MSKLVSQSSQVARLLRLNPQLVSHRGLQVAIGPRPALPRRCTEQRALWPRYYSSNSSPPDKKPQPNNDDEEHQKKPGSQAAEGDGSKPPQESKNDDQEHHKNTGDRAADDQNGPVSPQEPLPPLPEGWVRLSDHEMAQIEEIAEKMPGKPKKEILDTLIRIKEAGAPEQLREILAKMRENTGFMSWRDVGKFMRCIIQISRRLTEMEIERGQGIQTSNKDDTKEHGTKEQGGRGPKQDTTSRDKQSHSPSQGQKEPEQQGPKKEGSGVSDSIIMLVGIGATLWLAEMLSRPYDEKEITWEEMRQNFLDKGLVQKLVVLGHAKVRVELRPEALQANAESGPADRTIYTFSIGSVDSFEKKLEKAQDDLNIPPSQRIPVRYELGGSTLGTLFLTFGPTLLFVGLIIWSSKSMGGRGGGGGVFSFGKSRAKKFNAETAVKVKFADVAGLEEAKVEIMEFVSFLKQPERFEKLGAKIPRGAILSGPPGTGKTLLAKATAGESAVPFFSVSGSEFVEMFVGIGPSRVRDLFAEARKNAPCIVFIDEIDAIGRARAESRGFGGNDEREATLNQILTEMDGFNTREQVVVLAGTNRADILDKALMRPGRFDRHIYIDRPTMKGRKEIFLVYLKKIVTQEDKEHLIGRLATLTPGFSGADISNVVNEAALIAARGNADDVKMEHFERAIERVIGGLERKSLVLKPEDKKTVAYHEAGHAICGWFLEHADPLLKVSIIPRGQGALGYAQYLPQDAYLMNTAQLMDRMAMTLGGRVSEELHFPSVTTGASDDFKKVSQMARNMVTEWGMSDKVGPVHFENDPNRWHKPFAEATAQQIDQEVQRIIEEAYQRCRELLTAKKREVGIVAEELLKKEVLVRDDMVWLLGKRPVGETQEFEKYFGGGKEESAPPPFPTETDAPKEPPAERGSEPR